MSKLPLTKIIITLPSPDVAADIWKLFDYIITKMEELGEDGCPKVDAMGRKKFRAECMKAPDGTLYDVFTKWVTILVPEFVPATAAVLRQSAMSQDDLAKTAEKSANLIKAEKAVGAVDEARKKAAHDRIVANLKRARSMKKHPPKVKELAPMSKVEKAMLDAAKKAEGDGDGA